MTTQVSHLFEQLKVHYDEIVAIRRHLHKYRNCRLKKRTHPVYRRTIA